mmetsp:Transcript_51531/g.167213  ORF Transcript_51531/g.167213 Transcript_51531/m.167213 type:complete len:249 (+) Transcript_51531:1256-2002(+)
MRCVVFGLCVIRDLGWRHALLRKQLRPQGLASFAQAWSELGPCEDVAAVAGHVSDHVECLSHKWFSTVAKDLKVVHADQLKDLQRFSETTALKRAVLTEIAARLPMKSADRIVKFFSKLDENSDGTIDKDELLRGFKQIGLKDQGVIDKTFQVLDVDGDGILSLNEFAAGVLMIYTDLLEDRFRALFRRYDENCDGVLDREELSKLLGSAMPLAIHDSRGNPGAILEDMLKGSDGHLSYDEVKTRLLG